MSYITILFYWISFSFISERTVEIITSSKIFEPIREMIFKWANPNNEPSNNYFKWWLNGVITCGYCASVIIGCFYSLFIPYSLISYQPNHDAFCIILLFQYLFMWFYQVLNFVMSGLLIHGLSNLIHNLFELIRRGRVRTYDVTFKITEANASIDEEIEIDGSITKSS